MKQGNQEATCVNNINLTYVNSVTNKRINFKDKFFKFLKKWLTFNNFSNTSDLNKKIKSRY